MTNRLTMGVVGLVALTPASVVGNDHTRPNFVFMMTEDVSPHFIGLYNQGEGVHLPNVEKMATEGLVFNNAYSNAPVSSAARSTLFTGCYAPRMGISFHRRLEEVYLPEGQHMFPAYLRQAGYFTVNAFKTDYNCALDTLAWNIVEGKMGDWRKCKDKDQPFLFVRTNGASHESCLHFDERQKENRKTVNSPDDVSLLPMHPDTELFRYTYATFYDRIQKVDAELGEMINMLRKDGELDNTFIFYMGDNGGSLPGTKGYTTEGGLKVPLVVYVPKNWRNRLPIAIDSRIEGQVSFMDLGPTLLHLAGIEIPEGMDGTPFMGEDISLAEMNARDETYGYGDRFDELYAFNRTLRKGKYKYSRNFIPYHPKSLFALYRYKQMAFREWKEMYETGQLNEVQRRFFEPQGPEELYDLSVDPHEIRNLATEPAYQHQLQQMRRRLFDHMTAMNDLGLLPECIWSVEAEQRPAAYGQEEHKRIASALQTANLQLLDFDKGKKKAMKALRNADAVQRYWGVTACVNWGKEAIACKPALKELLRTEKEAFVQSRILLFLCLTDECKDSVREFKSILGSARNLAEALSVLNDMAYLKSIAPHTHWDMKEEDVPYGSEQTKWRIEYLNSH